MPPPSAHNRYRGFTLIELPFDRLRVVSKCKRSAFTLIELLIVIGIIGTLISLLLPAIQSAREAARRSACVNQQKQISLAIRNYESVRRMFPPGRIGCDDTGDAMDIPACPPGLTPEEKTAASGFISILPQLEEQVIFDQLSVADGGLWNRNVDDLSWYVYGGPKCRGIKKRIAIFVCPSDNSEAMSDVYHPVKAATASYAFVQGTLGPDSPPFEAKYENDGMFLYTIARRASQVTDGLAHTAMLGEVVLSDTWESSNEWSYALVNADCLRSTVNPLNTQPGAGITLDRQNGAFGSQHPGGAVFAFADGHVTFISDTIDLAAYRAISTIRGDELVIRSTF